MLIAASSYSTAAGLVSHTRDMGLTTVLSLGSQTPKRSGLPVHEGLTKQFPAETSNVTGILNQLNDRFLS